MRFSTFFWLALLVFRLVNAATSDFEFVSNKSNGLSKKFIKNLIDTFHPSVFFETGTYDGQTTLNAADFFDTVITVEIYPPLFTQIQHKFHSNSKIHSYRGNSSEIIAKIGKTLTGTILYWLDAHYSGEGTGMTNSANSGSAEAITAIREELKAIYDTGIQDCIILIDDIRGFGTQVNDFIFLGCWAYPTMQEIKEALLKINPQFKIALLGDMLLAYDGSKYHPSFSRTVDACTKTRLYDGYNLSEIDLVELGKEIQNASTSEKEYIKQLYDRMIIYKDPMFWHDVWYGLIQRKQGNHTQAEFAFQNASFRINSVVSQIDGEKIFQSISKLWKEP